MRPLGLWIATWLIGCGGVQHRVTEPSPRRVTLRDDGTQMVQGHFDGTQDTTVELVLVSDAPVTVAITSTHRPLTLELHGEAGLIERARNRYGVTWLQSAPGPGTYQIVASVERISEFTEPYTVLVGAELEPGWSEPVKDRFTVMYQQECDAQRADVCAHLGWFFLQEEQARGFALTQRACELGDMPACDQLGALYMDGIHVAPNRTRALQSWARACDGGISIACERPTWEVCDSGEDEDGDGRIDCDDDDCRRCDGCLPADARLHVIRDNPTERFCPTRVATERRCADGELHACERLALSRLLPTREETARAALWAQLCAIGHPTGCYETARHLEQADPSQDNNDAIVARYQYACAQGSVDACIFLGVTYQDGVRVPQDRPRALQAWARACDGGIPVACEQPTWEVCDSGEDEDGDGLIDCDDDDCHRCDGCTAPPSANDSERLYPSAAFCPARSELEADCEDGQGFACLMLAKSHLLTEEEAEQREALTQRACELGYAAACLQSEDTPAEH